MTITDEIRALVALIKPGETPGVPEVRSYLQGRSHNVTVAGTNLVRPAWAVAAATAEFKYELSELRVEVWTF